MKQDKQEIPQLTHEREYVLTKIYSKEFMQKRWKEIGYTPQQTQLKIKL